MGSHAGWNAANTFKGELCSQPGCEGRLTALYHTTLSAPYPWAQIGFTKSTIKCKQVGIVAVSWDVAQPFCPACGWHSDDKSEATKSEAIMRLMRSLVMRGVRPSEVQLIVGNAVSVIDVLAATYPEIESD